MEFSIAANHDKLCVFVRVPLVAWRANCDFRFLVDVDACENYCAKYATKDEKQTESFSKMMKKIVALAKKEGKSVKGCFSSLLIKTIGERDYTAQEVCGQLEQLPYVQYSRTVQKVNLSNMRSLAQKKVAKDDDCMLTTVVTKLKWMMRTKAPRPLLLRTTLIGTPRGLLRWKICHSFGT